MAEEKDVVVSPIPRQENTPPATWERLWQAQLCCGQPYPWANHAFSEHTAPAKNTRAGTLRLQQAQALKALSLAKQKTVWLNPQPSCFFKQHLHFFCPRLVSMPFAN